MKYLLTHDKILRRVQVLGKCRKLEYLSLLGCPVREKKWYRPWMIFVCKPLRVLDFERIKDKVRGFLGLLMQKSWYRVDGLELTYFMHHSGAKGSETAVPHPRQATNPTNNHALRHQDVSIPGSCRFDKRRS